MLLRGARRQVSREVLLGTVKQDGQEYSLYYFVCGQTGVPTVAVCWQEPTYATPHIAEHPVDDPEGMKSNPLLIEAYRRAKAQRLV